MPDSVSHLNSDALHFFSPTATHNPLRFYLPVADSLAVGRERRFLMGGVGLASAIDVLERVTERPLIWATAQYLSFAEPGSVVDLDVRAPVVGNTVTQARVVSHVGEREILTVNGAMGMKPDQPTAQFVTPDLAALPRPETCELHEPHDNWPGGLNQRFERRSIPDERGLTLGRTRMWIRNREGDQVSAGYLAIVADYLLGSVGPLLGRETSTSSIDNTLRLHAIEQAEWLFCETQVTAVANGFCYGQMHIFADSGLLLATGSQSGIVRLMP